MTSKRKLARWPVVRQAAIDANPGIPDTLNALAPLITDSVMGELNGQVIGDDGLEPDVVAREFLISQGLITTNGISISYDGIGIPACVASAEQAVWDLLGQWSHGRARDPRRTREAP